MVDSVITLYPAIVRNRTTGAEGLYGEYKGKNIDIFQIRRIISTSYRYWFEGLGNFSEVVSATVKESLNNLFEADISIMKSDPLCLTLDVGMTVGIIPNQEDTRQLFRISSIDNSDSGILSLKCKHISYDLNGQIITGEPPHGFDVSVYPRYSAYKPYPQNTIVRAGNKAYQLNTPMKVPNRHFLASYKGNQEDGDEATDKYFSLYSDDVEYYYGDCVSYGTGNNKRNYQMIWHDSDESIHGQNPVDHPEKWQVIPYREIQYFGKAFSLDPTNAVSSARANFRYKNDIGAYVSSVDGFKIARSGNYVVAIGRADIPIITKAYMTKSDVVGNRSKENESIYITSNDALKVYYSDDNGYSWNESKIEMGLGNEVLKNVSADISSFASTFDIQYSGAMRCFSVYAVGGHFIAVFMGMLYGDTTKSGTHVADQATRACLCQSTSVDHGASWSAPTRILDTGLAPWMSQITKTQRDIDTFNISSPHGVSLLDQAWPISNYMAKTFFSENVFDRSKNKYSGAITSIPGGDYNSAALLDGFTKNHNISRLESTMSDPSHISCTLLAIISPYAVTYETTLAGNHIEYLTQYKSFPLIETTENAPAEWEGDEIHAHTDKIRTAEFLYTSFYGFTSVVDQDLPLAADGGNNPYIIPDDNDRINIFGVQLEEPEDYVASECTFRRGMIQRIQKHATSIDYTTVTFEFRRPTNENETDPALYAEDFDVVPNVFEYVGQVNGILYDPNVYTDDIPPDIYHIYKVLPIPITREVKGNLYFDNAFFVFTDLGFYSVALSYTKTGARMRVLGKFFEYLKDFQGHPADISDIALQLNAEGKYDACIFIQDATDGESAPRVYMIPNISDYAPQFVYDDVFRTYVIEIPHEWEYIRFVEGNKMPIYAAQSGQKLSDIDYSDFSGLCATLWGNIQAPCKRLSQLVRPGFLNTENQGKLLRTNKDLLFTFRYDGPGNPECDDGVVKFDEPKSLRSILGNDVLPKFRRVGASLEQKYDPLEVKFDNQIVTILGENRGKTADIVISEGINAIDASLTKSIDTYYYAVYPYYYSEGSELVDLTTFGMEPLLYPGTAEGITEGFKLNILPLDLSTIQDADGNQIFESAPVDYTQMLDAVNYFVAVHKVYDPDISFEVKVLQFVNENGSKYEDLYYLGLGDKVLLSFPSMKYSQSVRITELTYNVLTGLNDSLTFGKLDVMLEDQLAGMDIELQNENKRAMHQTASKRYVGQAIRNATDKGTTQTLIPNK